MKQQVNDIAEVLRGLSVQIESMQKTIDSQHATICQINRTSQGHFKEIRDLKRMLKKKDKENEDLRKRLSRYEEPPKNSGNSSTPPSKEQMRDEIVRRTKSLRKPSGRKPGGQPGHEGNTLGLNDTVDNIMDEKPGMCDECGDSLAGLKIKLKTSGCFRSDLGADTFMNLHSIVETTKKHGNSPYNAILALF